jgi:hypothetical protein
MYLPVHFEPPFNQKLTDVYSAYGKAPEQPISEFARLTMPSY